MAEDGHRWQPGDYSWNPVALTATRAVGSGRGANRAGEQAATTGHESAAPQRVLPSHHQDTGVTGEEPAALRAHGRPSHKTLPRGPLVCQVEGCGKDLSQDKSYYQRYRACREHLGMLYLTVQGKPSRFCQQCGRFHELHEFDDTRRSCRASLAQHNERRRKKSALMATSSGSLPADAGKADDTESQVLGTPVSGGVGSNAGDIVSERRHTCMEPVGVQPIDLEGRTACDYSSGRTVSVAEHAGASSCWGSGDLPHEVPLTQRQGADAAWCSWLGVRQVTPPGAVLASAWVTRSAPLDAGPGGGPPQQWPSMLSQQVGLGDAHPAQGWAGPQLSMVPPPPVSRLWDTQLRPSLAAGGAGEYRQQQEALGWSAPALALQSSQAGQVNPTNISAPAAPTQLGSTSGAGAAFSGPNSVPTALAASGTANAWSNLQPQGRSAPEPMGLGAFQTTDASATPHAALLAAQHLLATRASGPDPLHWSDNDSECSALPASLAAARFLVNGATRAVRPYVSEDVMARLTLKIAGCTPDQLPPELYSRLQSALTRMDAMVAQGFLRPGCVHLALDCCVRHHHATTSCSCLAAAEVNAALSACVPALKQAVGGFHVVVGVSTPLSLCDEHCSMQPHRFARSPILLHAVAPVCVLDGVQPSASGTALVLAQGLDQCAALGARLWLSLHGGYCQLEAPQRVVEPLRATDLWPGLASLMRRFPDASVWALGFHGPVCGPGLAVLTLEMGDTPTGRSQPVCAANAWQPVLLLPSTEDGVAGELLAFWGRAVGAGRWCWVQGLLHDLGRVLDVTTTWWWYAEWRGPHAQLLAQAARAAGRLLAYCASEPSLKATLACLRRMQAGGRRVFTAATFRGQLVLLRDLKLMDPFAADERSDVCYESHRVPECLEISASDNGAKKVAYLGRLITRTCASTMVLPAVSMATCTRKIGLHSVGW